MVLLILAAVFASVCSVKIPVVLRFLYYNIKLYLFPGVKGLQKYHFSKKYHYQDCVFFITGISVYLPTYYVSLQQKHAEYLVILSANQAYQLSLTRFPPAVYSCLRLIYVNTYLI